MSLSAAEACAVSRRCRQPEAGRGLLAARSMNGAMSIIGPKRTLMLAPHMYAFGGKADIDVTLCGSAEGPSKLSLTLADYEGTSAAFRSSPGPRSSVP